MTPSDSSPAIAVNGTIYVGSRDMRLYAVNPDGSKKWEYYMGAEVRSSPAIGGDGTIYAGSKNGHVRAINPDGSLKWVYVGGFLMSFLRRRWLPMAPFMWVAVGFMPLTPLTAA